MSAPLGLYLLLHGTKEDQGVSLQCPDSRTTWTSSKVDDETRHNLSKREYKTLFEDIKTLKTASREGWELTNLCEI